ncbi:carboxylesterase family protein [Hyphobacterium sp.]|uniref:carboxylesterase family protein n=1 Tax=Hyphobacterium sp. TaxID=2004662 RepID=UPI003BAA9A71
MRVAIIGLALVLAACAQREAPVEPDAATRLTTPQGDVIGYVAESGAHVWRAIPFAAPPVGDLRWSPPATAPGWTQERLSIHAPTPCSQLAGFFNADALGAEAGTLAGSEDCLYLDVYAPPNAENLPVMMWIHGGSNTWGWADQYNGAQLAMDQNVVVVVVQYRLGPLGFFAHPALRAEAETEAGRAANFATLDHIAALEWIRDTIPTYGGNPDSVTVFGESAGGTNIAALLASPMAEGLFHRAIMQSGSANALPLAEAEGSDGSEVNASLDIAQRLVGNETRGENLRAVPVEDVFAAYELQDGRLEMPTMIADGVTVPADGIMAAFTSPDSFNAVPVITGTNRDEVKLYNAFNPDLVSRRLGVFFRIRDEDLYDAINQYQSDIWAINAVDEVAAAMTAGGHEDVWAYRFDWDEGGSNIFLDSSELLGAMHSMEIPFVFNHFAFFGSRLDPIAFNNENRDSRVALAQEMGAYWARFARAGDPGDSWQAWSEGPARMVFDTAAGGGSRMEAGEMTKAALAEAMSNDLRLDETQMCDLVTSMEGRYFDDEAQLRPLTGC